MTEATEKTYPMAEAVGEAYRRGGDGGGSVTGGVIARRVQAGGHQVVREYYVNDAGKPIETLGRSAAARLRGTCGAATALPEDGYPGEYLRDIVERDADALFAAIAAAAAVPCPQTDAGRQALLADRPEVATAVCGSRTARVILEMIKEDLGRCGIHFDHYVSELSLRASPAIDSALDELRARGLIYEREGAQWFRSGQYGDEKDRVVVRADGELTYFASDIGYHREKLRRGFPRLINVWGADHHGYVDRLRAAIQALGHPPDALQVLLVQIVNLTRGGQPVRMGKRSGEFVTLREVVEEVGADAARFFFLMRKSDSQLEFDLDLAKQQGADNPVFYVQYAHARCCSLFRQAAAAGVAIPDRNAGRRLALLSAPEEVELIKQLALFPDVVEEATRDLEPHRVVFFLIDLAGSFHRFYNRHRILGGDPEIGAARLYLAGVVRDVVRRGVAPVGVGAPEALQR